jgi:tRNA-2-methylthio-N6-dimethylallyladenosine synthase
MEENNEKMVGTIQEILVEGESRTNPLMLTGRTRSNKVVNFPGDNSLAGELINVKIVSQHLWYLAGEII